MRFIGNKESIKSEIYNLLDIKELTNKELTLFDAFCGSGAIADALKGSFNITINDILAWCVLYTKGRIYGNDCSFELLGFDPFDYLNSSKEVRHNFIYNNYSPGGSERKYFTAENAERIDYFRFQIEEWKINKLISDKEYSNLMACLIESVSAVSNTAGVYGAFLKEWDLRAIKPIQFIKVDSLNKPYGKIYSLNEKIENIINEVKCDVLYLDPPYTQNQYGTQYHLLETLVLNDNPKISKITGSRHTAHMRSDWSKEYKANILFDKVIAKTQAKYILFSYNNDGFMSKDFIESCLKRYGIPETYTCKKIPYKKYRNWKTKKSTEHFEYLFFIEKKPTSEVVYESPLNYIGSKAKMVNEVRHYVPSGIETVIDAFGGGFNVGINLPAKKIVYNDINYFVTQLIQSFRDTDTYKYLLSIRQITKKFGLEKGNADTYINARKHYNSLESNNRDPKFLFTLILYGFQQQIRFNSEHDFNNPVGNRWFNDKVLEKFISFSRRLKELDCDFLSCDFNEVLRRADTKTFVYLDPPYRFTRGSYNDGKRGFEGWANNHEVALLKSIDKLNSMKIPFMLSYVMSNNGHYNEILDEWLNQKSNYKVIDIDCQGRYAKRKEVLVVNYE